jgi:uncharacterized metal-binding protein
MTAMYDVKVGLVGCGGIGRLASTVVRQAVYMVEEDRPENVVPLTAGALAAGSPEKVEIARRLPLVVIDGCRPRCATAIAAQIGAKPAAVVWAAEVVAKHRISLAGEKRTGLGDAGMLLARRIADEAIAAIDLIVAEEALSTL